MNTEQIAALAAVITVVVTIIGWIVAYITAYRMSVKAMQLNMDYEIYKSILEKSNSITKNISEYVSSLNEHARIMAKILDEVHGGLEQSKRRYDDLVQSWADQTWGIASRSFEIQEHIIDYMRLLDMSGTDYHSSTVIYKALQSVQADAIDSMKSINDRWFELNLSNTTVPQFRRLQKDTEREVVKINEFNSCLEDALKHIYNGMIAKNAKKPKKYVDMSVRRRVITEDGLVDNRFGVRDR